MTTENGAPPPILRRTRRHRLTDREDLTRQLVKRYGDINVATYALAVRDLAEKHPEIGPVDTWLKVVQKIMRGRERGQGDKPSRKPPMDKAEQSKLRKKLSWHFSVASRGPAWLVAERLVWHLVPAELQAETLAHLKDLHKAARGVYPNSTEPTDAGTPEDGGTVTIEDGQIEALKERITVLERQLTARQDEIGRLRTQLAHHTGRPAPTSDNPTRQAALGLVKSPRAGQARQYFPDGLTQVDLVQQGRTGAGAIYWVNMFPHNPSRITRTPAQGHRQASNTADRFATSLSVPQQFGR